MASEEKHQSEPAEKAPRIITQAEVSEHKTASSTWVIIHNKVYDVTKFLSEHPGGEEVLLEQAGVNATDAFEDVGHSTDARDMLPQYYIGDLAEVDQVKEKDVEVKLTPTAPELKQEGTNVLFLVVPIVVAVVALLAYRLFA